MKKETKAKDHRGLLLSLVILGLAAALIILPNQFRSEAGGQDKAGKGLVPRTESHDEGLPNYDIRIDKNESAGESLVKFRLESGKDAAVIADTRESFVRGEDTLRQSVPTLKVEYNEDIRIPEVIAPDIKQGINFLTSPSSAKRAEILRNFVKQNSELVGASDSQINALKVIADYTNPDGNLSFAHLEQRINDVPVFRGEVKAGFNRAGQIVRVINNLAPGLDYESLSTDFGDPAAAVRAAASHINYAVQTKDVTRNAAESTDLMVVFGDGPSATTAEKMYFPTEPGVARAAWRVLIWQPVNAYYIIVDAETGTMLWRKNIGEDQTQSATYNVYANPNAMINVARSPFPWAPGPTMPTGTISPTDIGRTNVTRIGNEAPYTFNNNGWITDGANGGNGFTDGNSTEAGLDVVAPDGIDAPVSGTGRTFNFAYSPYNPVTMTGDAPTVPAHQSGSVVQLFYICNWFHDEMYRLGFTEQAFNFQDNNFGRGGVGGDRVRCEAQDSSGTNNANFNTPADGGRGRMQMFRWTLTTPNLDGSIDADIVIHEFTHGLSNRLHGNASGLSTNMSRMMGEGWSDFYSHVMLSQESDPINGVYTLSGWATLNLISGLNSYYYGIRRFPKAVMAFTGGPNNRPHNPITFADVDQTTVNYTNGAFAAPSAGHLSTTADQVHSGGEVWSAALWEVRAKFVQRLGWAVGNRKTLQLVTDGMKLAPLGPTYLQERDAILAAAAASSAAPEAGIDVADVWAGFAIRGMGFSAVVNAAGTGGGTARVTEAFDLPNLLQTPTFTFSDAGGNNNGFADPGEPLVLTIPISNSTGGTATGTNLQIVGGGSANYGDIASGQTVTRTVNYTVPANQACGSILTLTMNVTSSLGPTSFTRNITIGQAVGTVQNFDGVTAPALPAGWTSTFTGAATGWTTSTTTPSSAPNAAFAADPAVVGISELETPAIAVNAAAAALKFKINYNTENTFDGTVLEMKIGAGAYQDIIAAGGSFVANGYNGTLATGFSNPLPGRQAWTGNSSGYRNVEVTLPAAANGQNVQFKFRMGSDSSVSGAGVRIDDFELISSFNCAPVNPPSGSPRADFDGDGRTDLSVFRPSEGNWYLNRSTAGFTVLNWGLSGDVLTPGDYDGDGKADTAVFRASAAAGTPDFYILRSSNSTIAFIEWGTTSDVPVVGDYDGDGNDDVSVFRPSNNTWYILRSGGGVTFTPYGLAGDVPLVADWDGDGKSDLTVKRGNSWIAALSGGGSVNVPFGLAGDLPVQADYDGDNKDDIAVFRPSNGTWYALLSSNGSTAIIPFGTMGDVPVPGDYDGDGKDDQAIYRNGQWWVRASTSGTSVSNFGLATDKPIPNEYLP